jgi:anhydro-N-acetylmuramic acid kinase
MKNSETKSYRVVGLMSGTSLDGLDIAYCLFWEENNKWRFKIPVAHTYDYPQIWKSRLRSAVSMSGQELVQLNNEYGRYLGELANTFILDNSLHPDLIASHGHTVFHQPEAGLTFQIGSGAEITAVTGITVVCDFRSQDVALGGQGAPLVPIVVRSLSFTGELSSSSKGRNCACSHSQPSDFGPSTA